MTADTRNPAFRPAIPGLATTFTAPLLALLVLACAPAQIRDPGVEGPPPAPREMRAAWIATVNNIDWPSRKGLSTDDARDELRRLIEQSDDCGLNAVFFQVRPNGDALYRSRFEPWSEWLTGTEGKAPEPAWDPLEFAIEEAHLRGLELHAWLNPYRARHASSKTGPASNHIQARYPKVVHAYAGHQWMDPGEPVVQEWTERVVLDIVKRYDVDGIHFDDYFYPYPSKGRAFPDDRSWERLGKRSGLERDDWRRQNVDRFVARLNRSIHEARPTVRFGISPFGIWRPGHPKGISGMDQYASIYADPRKWLRRADVDYLVPQLYWPIDQKAQAYVPLQEWWAEQNTENRHLWIGNFASKTIGKNSAWPVSELLDQIAATRRSSGATGNVLFSIKALAADLGPALRRGPYARDALVPASPWLDDEAPGRVAVSKHGVVDGALELSWHEDRETFVRTLYIKRRDGGWEFVGVLPGTRLDVRLPAASTIEFVALGAIDRTGNESQRTILGDL